MRHKLYRLAKLLLRRQEDVEDALQEVFLKLWMIRDKLATYRSIEALGMRITKNLCLSKLKAQNRRRTVDVEALEVNSGRETPYQEIEFSDSVRVLQELIDRLPQQQKLIFHLRHVEQYSFEEIEAITGLPVTNIRTSLCRARQRVNEHYVKMNKYEMPRPLRRTGGYAINKADPKK